MFKPVLLQEDDMSFRVEFRAEPIDVPAPVAVPKWLGDEIFYVWKLEHEAGRAIDKIRAIKVIRSALGLELKPAKDVMDALYDVQLRCMGLAG